MIRIHLENLYNIMKKNCMMPFKKFKITLIFYKKNVFIFFIACCSLYETDKYSIFNFFFKLSECPKSADRYAEPCITVEIFTDI